jgi:FOG: Ankyrin repeat
MVRSSSSAGSQNHQPDKFDLEEYDEQGWTPLHHAAHAGYFKKVNRLVEGKPSRLEVKTQDKLKVTALWLAFSEGQAETIDTLLIYGADLEIVDCQGNDVIDIVFINKHHRLLLHLIKKVESLTETIWVRLKEYASIENLNNGYLEMCLKIATELTKNAGDSREEFRKRVTTNRIFALYRPELMPDHPQIEMMLVTIIRNMINDFSTNPVLFDILTERLLRVTKTCTSNVILSILRTCSQAKDFPRHMIQKERFTSIVKFIEVTKDETYRIECFQIIRHGIKNSAEIQNFFHQRTSLLDVIIHILSTTQNEVLQIICLKTLRGYVLENTLIQQKLQAAKIYEPLKPLLALKEKSTAKEISKFIYVTTKENKQLQLYYIKQGAIEDLAEQLKKLKEDNLQEWIMRALWGIGGGSHQQTLFITKSISMPYVISLATSNSSPILQYYGGEFLQVLMRIATHHLSYSAKESISLHLLNSSLKSSLITSEMLISTLKTIQTLCIGRGHTPNQKIQKIAMEKNSIAIFLQMSTKTDDPWIELEAYQTFASLLLTHNKGLEILRRHSLFPPIRVMKHLLSHDDPCVISKASHVLAYFLLEKENKRKLIRGFRLPIQIYERIMETNDETMIVDTAFQLVVLNEFITSSTPVETTLQGIYLLKDCLIQQQSSGHIIARAADHVAGLAQYCHGLKAAFTTAEFVDVLCDLMCHEDDTVKTAVAVAIAVLARYLKAEILLLRRCRKDEELVGIIEKWTDMLKLPLHFKERWSHYLSLKNVNA